MKKLTLISLMLFVLLAKVSFSQENEGTSVQTILDRLAGVDENLATLNTDVSILKKIKITGYYQFEFLKTESIKGLAADPYDANDIVLSQFRIRRGRVKIAYDGGLTQFVFQGDFINSGFSLKDFYMDITDPWTKYFTLRAGLFNRPNYEVEYSSSQRESMERSLVVRTLYPGERDLGAMITINPDEMFNLQFAAFNNTYQGAQKQFTPNFRDQSIYYMARLTKSFTFMDLGLSVDLGASARFGSVRSNTKYVIESDQSEVKTIKVNDTTSIPVSTISVGDPISRNWFGAEAQIYWDFLGGAKLLSEIIFGNNVDEPSVSKTAIRKRNFLGYYFMFVKNLGDDWQVAIKYDSYNPNTKIDKSKIISISDLPISTLGFGIHNYSFSNVRISLWYEMPKHQINENIVSGKKLLETDPVDNILTIRLQFKF